MKFIGRLLKKLFKLVFWILLIAIVLVAIIYWNAGKLIQYFAPTAISEVTKTETTLGDVDVSLLTGRVSLNDLTVGNPAGFKDKNAFELGHISISFDPQSVLSDKIIVHNVLIKRVHLSTELNSQGKTNISELLDNVNEFTGASSSQPEQPAAQQPAPAQKSDQDKPSKTVVIRDLKVVDSSVRAGIAGQMIEIPLPEIHQQNIGEKKKQSIAEIVADVLGAINVESTKAVVNATKEALGKNIQAGKEAVKSLTDSIKNLF